MDSKKNILFINGHLNVGGCERSLVDVLSHFDYHKYNVDLLLLEEKGDYTSEIPSSVNVYLYSLNQAFGRFSVVVKQAIREHDWFSLMFRICYLISSKFGNQYLKATKKLFSKIKPEYDAIIAYRPGICTDLAAYVFSSEEKISWWHHGEMNVSGTAVQKLNESYSKMTHIVTVSESSAKIVCDTFPDMSSKICVIPNMICSDTLYQKATEYNPIVTKNNFILVSVGRMSPEKNMCLCPEIGKILFDMGLDFTWYLIGDGAEYDEITQQIQKLKLERHFVLTGTLNNPYPYMKKADVLVHTSKVESQGITILEAMALGTSVVVSNSQGPREFIVNGVNGYILSGRSDEMARCILKLSKENSNKDLMAIHAKDTVKRYEPNDIIERINRLF